MGKMKLMLYQHKKELFFMTSMRKGTFLCYFPIAKSTQGGLKAAVNWFVLSS